ncbi:MAG: hypothetical protein IJA84_04810 [Clostridia bacterium]|nr:hypothetical protein [Clostridia bacterium]
MDMTPRSSTQAENPLQNEPPTAEARGELLTYLQTCFNENLNHARHVENERLTFTSIYIAMVIGAVAVVFGLENNWVAFSVSLMLTGFAVMAVVLNHRWQGIFDKHKAKVKACENEWCRLIGKSDETLGGYYNGFYKGKKEDKSTGLTKKIFYILYGTVLTALVILTGYLLYLAVKSPTGEGFYFSSESVQAMKDFLTKILEAQK